MYTISERIEFRAAMLFLLLFLRSLVKAQITTVNWSTTYLTIDGFGASTGTNYGPGASLNSTQADLFFSTTSGVGFSLLRASVPDNGDCTSVNSGCAGDSLEMQAAASYGAKVGSTPWSPPASMKSNGSIPCNTDSGNAALNAASYGAYATYLSNYISSLAAQHVSLYALSVQNEPDYCPGGYDGAVWSASQMDTFISKNLGPTLAANGQSGVLIVMPEASLGATFNNEASNCMTDS